MRTMKEGYTNVVLFDNPAEVVQACRGSHFHPGEEKLGRRLSSWGEVVRAIDQPWKQGLEAVERFVTDLREKKELPEIKSRVRRPCFLEDDGDDLDLDRLRAGQPYWRSSHRAQVVGMAEVTIVVDLSASKDVSPTDILWRGAAAVAMAQILEEKGFSVSLWAVQTSCPYADSTYERLMVGVCLKDFGDRLDVSTLINCVSGWYYRAVLFTLTRSLLAREGRKVASGLGTPESPYSSEMDLFSKRENRLYSGSSFSFYGAMAATEWGLEKVAKSQQPPVQVYEPDPIPQAVVVSSGTSSQPSQPVRPSKPMKVKKVKRPKPEKRLTQD